VSDPTAAVHTISVVIPVYQGESTLQAVVEELASYLDPTTTPHGHDFVVREVLLVHDNGPDASDVVMRRLAAEVDQVRAVWLTRNFGQHAATLAGMASTGSDWIVTMDEDGQHDPADIPHFLDTALQSRAQLVYGEPTNEPPHGRLRNLGSRGAKRLLRTVFGFDGADEFNSYRLVLGEIGRSVAAYAGAGIYLDVALRWITGRVAKCPTELRLQSDRRSGYSPRTLLSHFWRMVLSSGTRGLRIVSGLGVTFGVFGILLAAYAVFSRVLGTAGSERGWTSVMVVLSLGIGAVLFSLGVVAEYVGVVVKMAMGRPLYQITHDPDLGPLGRQPVTSTPVRDPSS
jgi:undecaprenyl-phosphate 4-deoxy-4-formamido-L-arabinose transferase